MGEAARPASSEGASRSPAVGHGAILGGMTEENGEIARLWWARFNEDGEPPLDLCHPDIEMRNPDGFPVTGPYFGREGIRQWAVDVYDVVDDARGEVEEVVDVGDGDSVIAVLRQTGRWKHTQISAEVKWAAVMTMRDGKLFRAKGFLSKGEALEAAGLAS